MSEKPRARALCAGCVHFRVTGGAFKYTCLIWSVSSAEYNIARLIHESIGEPCPYCRPARRGGRQARPPEEMPTRRPDHDGLIDLRV